MMKKKKKNSLTTSVVLMILFFTLLLKSCTSFQLDHPYLLTTSLPRKLNMEIKATKTTRTHVEPQVKANDGIIGGLKKKDVKMMQITRQKWKEWEETHDQSDLFTMDYRRVRRRRPIHNKSLLP